MYIHDAWKYACIHIPIYIYTHTHVMQQVILMKKRISLYKHLFEFVPDKFK